MTGKKAYISGARPDALRGGGAAAAMRELLPWAPLLTDEDVQRAQGYYGSGTAMRKVASKLLTGEPIQVYTLGGSVTRGLGASAPSRNYANRFFQLINASFPHRWVGGCVGRWVGGQVHGKCRAAGCRMQMAGGMWQLHCQTHPPSINARRR
jgi:hypothetical protein